MSVPAHHDPDLPAEAVRTGRRVPFGIERVSAGDRPRHRHGPAYATIVLAGSFEQAGYFGRYRLEAGDILLQPTLDAHADGMVGRGLEIIRLPWKFDSTSGRVIRGCDVDALRRVASRDVAEAAAMLQSMAATASTASPLVEHEADLLAQTFTNAPSVGISDVARSVHLSRERLSRLFRRTYGVCAVTYRGELRARAAWRACMNGEEPLAEVAAALGFSDQAHMTRSVQHFTGVTPGSWRRWSRRQSALSL